MSNIQKNDFGFEVGGIYKIRYGTCMEYTENKEENIFMFLAPFSCTLPLDSIVSLKFFKFLDSFGEIDDFSNSNCSYIFGDNPKNLTEIVKDV